MQFSRTHQSKMSRDSIRTDTSATSSVFLDRPGAAVHIQFPNPTNPDVTTFRIPKGSKWTPSPHWHESYVEFFRVLVGRIRFVLEGSTKVITPDDGLQTVPKFAVHEFMRADIDNNEEEADDFDVVVEEYVEPCKSFTFLHRLCYIFL